MKKIHYILFGSLLAFTVSANQAHAEWPEKSIEFVIPFGAGGGADDDKLRHVFRRHAGAVCAGAGLAARTWRDPGQRDRSGGTVEIRRDAIFLAAHTSPQRLRSIHM